MVFIGFHKVKLKGKGLAKREEKRSTFTKSKREKKGLWSIEGQQKKPKKKIYLKTMIINEGALILSLCNKAGHPSGWADLL